jgi:hypothetical protein
VILRDGAQKDSSFPWPPSTTASGLEAAQISLLPASGFPLLRTRRALPAATQPLKGRAVISLCVRKIHWVTFLCHSTWFQKAICGIS